MFENNAVSYCHCVPQQKNMISDLPARAGRAVLCSGIPKMENESILTRLTREKMPIAWSYGSYGHGISPIIKGWKCKDFTCCWKCISIQINWLKFSRLIYLVGFQMASSCASMQRAIGLLCNQPALLTARGQADPEHASSMCFADSSICLETGDRSIWHQSGLTSCVSQGTILIPTP